MLNIDDCTAAKQGLLVMYAWDMCDGDLDPTSSKIDPRIAADGWDVVGIITSPDSVGSTRFSALLFASPKTGDHEFAGAFDKQAGEYIVINYEHDLVPQVPLFDITHLDIYRTLPICKVISDETAKAKINENDKMCSITSSVT